MADTSTVSSERQHASAVPGLLRQRAYEQTYRRDGGLGPVIVPISSGVKIAAMIALVCGSIFLAVVITARLPVVHRVSGTVVMEQGVVRVVPQMAGSLSEILVSEGSSVKAGQPIMVIVAQNSADVSTGQNASRLALIEESMELAQTRRDIEVARIRDEITFLQNERLPGLQALENLLMQQKDFATLKLERAQLALDRSLALNENRYITEERLEAARNDVSVREVELLSIDRELLQIVASRTEAELRIAQATAEINVLQLSADQQMVEQRALQAQLQQDVAITVESPVDGVVASLAATPGQHILGNEELAVIMPSEGKVLLQFDVLSDVVGLIEEGTELRVTYPSFPSERYGVHDATVASISLTSVASAGMSDAPGQPPRQDIFRVRAVPLQDHVMVDGQQRRILPGMRVDGAIILRRTTILDWVLGPIRSGVQAVRL